MQDSAAGSAAPRRADLIVEGAYVVTLDSRRPIIVDGSVAVVGRAIAAVRPGSSRPSGW